MLEGLEAFGVAFRAQGLRIWGFRGLVGLKVSGV